MTIQTHDQETELDSAAKVLAFAFPKLTAREPTPEAAAAIPDTMKLPLVSCPKCNTPVEIRFGRSTAQFLGAHVYRPSCPLSNRMWLRLGTDRAEAIVECRKRIMEETTDL